MWGERSEYYYAVDTDKCCNPTSEVKPLAGKPLFPREDNPLDLGNAIKRNSEKIKDENISDKYSASMTAYMEHDILTYEQLQKIFNNEYWEFLTGIEKVIFNGPATIVIWLDGEKTVVKCAEGDEYSKFAGLAIAICKHQYGINFKKIFNHFIPKEEEECHSSETTNSKQ